MGGKLTVPVTIEVPEERYREAQKKAQAGGHPTEEYLADAIRFEISFETESQDTT